ncbi:MAG: hypothetical protein C4293_07820 [Nitrospiraceae bacterium]
MLKDWLRRIFDVFSRRYSGRAYEPNRVSETVRNKVLLLCRDVFSGLWREPRSSPGDYTQTFWEEIHKFLQYLHGRPKLSQAPEARTPCDDALHFLLHCESQEFLDFIELIFKVECLFHVILDENEMVEAVNEIFRSERAPYQATPMVKREEKATGGHPPFSSGTVIRTVAFPKVVRAEEEVTFTEAISPVLSVLADQAYGAANIEFRDALEEYRKGDYGDCLVKCGSAFESVMKVLCQKNGWVYPQDTAASLLKTVLARTNLDSFFEHPLILLILIATLRNRLSKAHGAGHQARHVKWHVAQYAITSTAAAILLLVHETA